MKLKFGQHNYSGIKFLLNKATQKNISLSWLVNWPCDHNRLFAQPADGISCLQEDDAAGMDQSRSILRENGVNIM